MILAFPFAGGDKHSFQYLSKNISEIIIVDYPGRGNRITETLITDINVLVEDLLSRLIEKIKEENKYVIYGHSIGAIVAYLFSAKVNQLGLPKPTKLVVSGSRPRVSLFTRKLPHYPINDFGKRLLKSEEFQRR